MKIALIGTTAATTAVSTALCMLVSSAALAQAPAKNSLIPPPSPLQQFVPSAQNAPASAAAPAAAAAAGSAGSAAAQASSGAPVSAAAATQTLPPSQDANRPFNPQLEAGLKALERKHYATALRSFTDLANAGEPRAQNNMGIMYERGLGVLQSYVEAMNWYRRAADQSLPEAQFNVGSLYHNGYGVEVNNS